MKNFGIARRLALAALAITVIVGGQFGLAAHQSARLVDAVGELDHSGAVLRRQMEADMMHDALRGSVLEAMLVGRPGEPETVASIRAATAEQFATFRDAMAINRDEIGDARLRAMIERTSLAVEEYGTRALQVVDLAAADRAAADRELKQFLAVFDRLVDGMAEVSDAIEEARTAVATASADAAETTRRSEMIVGVVALIALLALFASVARAVLRPLGDLRHAMARISGGDLATDVPYRDHQTEVGQMARSLELFRETALEAERQRAALDAERLKAAESRREGLATMAARLEGLVGEQLAALGDAARQAMTAAEAMQTNAEATSARSAEVAGAAEQSGANAQAVASSGSELSASVAEIARQASAAADMTRETSRSAREGDQRMQALRAAAEQIGEAIVLINDIAARTNLLALNATIEAARAGEYGKGFAVVASEVKSLANQTAQATDSIALQVNAIRQASELAVAAVSGILQGIGQVETFASAISAAVEQQEAATSEIARTVEESASASHLVTVAIGDVSRIAADTGRAAQQIRAAVEGVSHRSGLVRGAVDSFLAEVRAA